MTPKEKAQELFTSMDMIIYTDQDNWKQQCKQCALIAVDEIIDALEKYDDRNDTYELQNMDGDFRYWDEVKQEIEKI